MFSCEHLLQSCQQCASCPLSPRRRGIKLSNLDVGTSAIFGISVSRGVFFRAIRKSFNPPHPQILTPPPPPASYDEEFRPWQISQRCEDDFRPLRKAVSVYKEASLLSLNVQKFNKADVTGTIPPAMT